MLKFVLIALLIFAAVAIFRAYAASQQESREARTLRALPPSVQHVVARMDPPAQAALFDEYERKRKKTSVGYLLWLIGFHYLYYSKVGLFFAYFFTWGGAGIWALVDLFRMHSIARSANEQMARQALQTLGLAAFTAPPIQQAPPIQPAPAEREIPANLRPPPPPTTTPGPPPRADTATPPAPLQIGPPSTGATDALPQHPTDPGARATAPPLPPAGPQPARDLPPPLPPAPTTAPEPSSPRSQPYLLVAGVAVVALALAAVALVLVTQRHPTPAALTRTDQTPTGNQIQAPAPAPDQPTTSPPSTDTPTTSASPSGAIGIVDISNVMSDPRADQIGQTLNSYFQGIDQKDYSQALSVVDRALVDSSDPSQVGSFERGVSTSNDSNIAVVAIGTDPQAPSGVSVNVTFESTQAPSLGPDGESCTDWNLQYLLTGSPETSFRLYKSHGSQAPC